MNTTQAAQSGSVPTTSVSQGAEAANHMFFDRDRNPVEFGRVLALSDGVFAIALTLLVLDLALPEATERDGLARALVDRQAHFFGFAVSVLLVGNVWVNHHRLFSLFQSVNVPVMGANIVYLGLATLFPFFQSMVTRYPVDPVAYMLFAALVVALLLVDAAVFLYGVHKGLFRVATPPRWIRSELTQSAMSVGVFLLTIPLAILIGPFVAAIWIAMIPMQALLMHRQAKASA